MSPHESDFFPDWAWAEADWAAGGWAMALVDGGTLGLLAFAADRAYYFKCFMKMAGWTGKQRITPVNSGRKF